jgi:4,5-dihydroxyphthalate decarboxylase
VKLPPNVIHTDPGQSLQSMMASGEVRAGFAGPAGVGRSRPPISGWDQATQVAAVADTYPELIGDVESVEADCSAAPASTPFTG